MSKIDFKNLGRGKLLKSKREVYLLTIFILALFLRFVIPGDIKKIKNANLENLAKQEELNRKKTEIFSVESLIKDQQRYEDEYIQTIKTSEALDKKINEFKNALVKKEAVAEVLSYLTAIAKPGEIEFSLITMGPMVKYDNYNELPVKMKINTDYYNLMDYIRNLESLSFLIEIMNLKIVSPQSNGEVNVEAEFVTYVSK